MLKHSVQIELFPILWVTKLIYSESPMYPMLDKDTIKNEILPHLSKAKRGYVTQSCLIEVVNAILYKLKTGCQWALLPVEALFSGKVLSHGAVYHHYNKWSKLLINILKHMMPMIKLMLYLINFKITQYSQPTTVIVYPCLNG